MKRWLWIYNPRASELQTLKQVNAREGGAWKKRMTVPILRLPSPDTYCTAGLPTAWQWCRSLLHCKMVESGQDQRILQKEDRSQFSGLLASTYCCLEEPFKIIFRQRHFFRGSTLYFNAVLIASAPVPGRSPGLCRWVSAVRIIGRCDSDFEARRN